MLESAGMVRDSDPGPHERRFPSTLWNEIQSVQAGGEVTRDAALNTLLEAYWRPVYACVRYGWNRDPEEAKDLTQALFAELLEREFWRAIDPAKGRFRSFLKAAIKNFMLVEERDRTRLKRGGGRTRIPLDQMEKFGGPPASGLTPDQILDREWTRTVVFRAVEESAAELTGLGKAKHLEVLRKYYVESSGGAPPSYGEIAERSGMSEDDVRYYLHEVRLKLRARVMEAIRRYVVDESDLQDELRFILG